MKRAILGLFALIVAFGAFTPAEAQHHRHRHCIYRHHHRVCRWD